MSSKMSNVAKSFLNELTQFKDSNDMLFNFLEHLEEKHDPTSEEIQLASDIYQFLEKMNILKENLKNYTIKEYNRYNYGHKLSSLLENQDKINVDYY